MLPERNDGQTPIPGHRALNHFNRQSFCLFHGSSRPRLCDDACRVGRCGAGRKSIAGRLRKISPPGQGRNPLQAGTHGNAFRPSHNASRPKKAVRPGSVIFLRSAPVVFQAEHFSYPLYSLAVDFRHKRVLPTASFDIVQKRFNRFTPIGCFDGIPRGFSS